MNRRAPVVGAVLALVTVASACSANSPASPPAPSTPPPATASPFPPRPRPLALDTVNPCDLLTAAQVKTLGTKPGQAYENDSATGDRSCSFDTSDTSRLIAVRTKQSAAIGLQNPGATQLVVDGYGAVQTGSQVGDPRSTCVVIVDVADQQSVQSTYVADPGTPGVTTEVACQGARDLATMAVQNLAAGR